MRSHHWIRTHLTSVILLALGGCATMGEHMNPFREPTDPAAYIGDRDDSALNEKKEKEDTFQKEARELRRLREEAEAGLKEMDKTITSKLLGEIRDVITKVGEEGKYTIILEKDASVLYMPDSINMTSKVIENYDKQKAKK